MKTVRRMRDRPPLPPGILAAEAEIVAQDAANGMTDQHIRSYG